MPATNKVGTQLLVSPHMRDRARALAVIRRESVAEIYRTVLDRYLNFMEQEHAAEISALYAEIDRRGLDRGRALEHLINKRINLILRSGQFGAGSWPEAVWPEEGRTAG